MEVLMGFAEAHHGLVHGPAAQQLGVTADQVYGMVRRGRLERVGPQVFRIPGSVPTWEQDELQAVWGAGAAAVAGIEAAARLWELPGFERAAVEVLRRGHVRRRRRGITETRFLPPRHISEIASIPITTAERTLFDLCGRIHPGRAERAVDNALAMKLVTLESLESVLGATAARGRPGSCTLREILSVRGEGYVPPESELEALVVSILRTAGLPVPEKQQWVGDDAAAIGRVDFLYRRERLVIEADSARHHSSWLDSQADRRRDLALAAGGYTVIRVTWRQLVDEPEKFVAAVRGALLRAAS
jgi:hypothetical protein